jgi:DMSO reductase anchor subunit
MGLRLSRAVVLAVALAACLAAAACSSDGDQTAAKLMPNVQAAAVGATSVHMTGSVNQGKQTATFDVSFTGTSVAGTLGLGGKSFGVLVLGAATYVKVDAAFLDAEDAPASVCAKVCGKYVELSASTASQITGFLSMRVLMTSVIGNNNLSAAGNSSCVFSPATRNGQSVLECRQGAYTLDVAAHGKPYIVYFGGPHGEYIAFSGWNAVTPPTAPPVSEVVSINSLG